MQEVKKIVVIGPESTGKSTLCKQLAAHFDTQWCPEYARAYLLEHGTAYTLDDLLKIAQGQLILEDTLTQYVLDEAAERHANTPPLLFIDTDMYVMKVWCDFVFNQCHTFITEQIAERKYDLYLLCNTDLPWVKDELREYPDLETREKLYAIYKDIMISQSTPWVEIGGNDEARLQKAIEAVNQYITS